MPSMSQWAQGSFNTQIAVIGSDNVSITVNRRHLIDLEPRAFPLPFPEIPTEIDLLKAPYAQIPFVGRDDLLQDFLDWCNGDKAVSCRIVTGRGGAGKTRFAYELFARIANLPNWKAYFLHFLEGSARGVNLWNEVKSKNALLVADYASDTPAPLADLLRSLNRPAPEGHRIRVLLLARTANWDQGWLSTLRSERTGEDADRLFHPRDPIELQPPTLQQRYEIFQKTVAKAAQVASKPVPSLPAPEKFAQRDIAERLADPLTLMMAALIALESDAYSALSLNRTELAYLVADRLVAGRMKTAVRDHQELLLHMAAYATISGGLSEDEALAALEEESKATHLGAPNDPKPFLQKLQAWLPGEKSKTWLGTIQPDIVGEAFVLGKYLHDPEPAVLRAAACNSASTTNTLVRLAQDFSLLLKDSRHEPIEWLTRLVERGEADSGIRALAELADAFPRSTVVMAHLGLRISEALSARLRHLRDDPHKNNQWGVLPLLADALNGLANRQSAVGQQEEALSTAKEVVERYRELAKENRDAFLPGLAGTLSNLSLRQREAGERDAALPPALEAVALWRALVLRDRNTFLSDLATSLNNLALSQREVGQHEAALASADEAAEGYRELVGRRRDVYLPGLAMSLANLSNMQSETGQKEAALATALEAAELRRELVGRNRDEFLRYLAVSLNNLANRQRDMGQQEAAVATAEEALRLKRELMARDENAFVHTFVVGCGALGSALHAASRAADGQSVYVEGLRAALPEVPKLPAVFAPLSVKLLRDYLEKGKASGLKPDASLLSEAAQVLDPYLKKKRGVTTMIAALASAIITALQHAQPWLADKAGGAVVALPIREMWELLKKKLGPKPTEQVEHQPDDANWESLRARLLVALEDDPDFRAQLESLTKAAGISQVVSGDNNVQNVVKDSKNVNISIG